MMDGFAFIDESARALLSEQPDFRNRWEEFHLAVYARQLSQEKSLGEQSFVSDRGTVDAFAFHPATMQLVHTCLEAEYRRYDAVIQLGTTAHLGDTFYRGDNIRTELPEEAIAIEESLQRVWQGHSHYRFIPAAESFQLKYDRLIDIIEGMVRKESD